jgi:hypothetical protein
MIRRTMNESYGRPSFIGPAFILALVLSGYLLWRQYSDQPVALPQFASGPAIERTLLPSRLSGPAPSPDFVLLHLSDMRLTAKAKASLEALSRKSAEELRPLKDQADRASAGFREYMGIRERSGRTSMGDVRAQMDRTEAAMRRANDAVVKYWRDAVKTMTPDQKAQLERKWQEEKQGKKPAQK